MRTRSGFRSASLCVLLALGLAAEVRAAAAPAAAGAAPSFSHDAVLAEARALAMSPFVPPREVSSVLADLDYDSYRAIRYDKERAIRFHDAERFSVELFAPGFLFGTGVDLFVVTKGVATPLLPDAASFETPSPEIAAAIAELGRFAGFRLHYPINEPITGSDYADEFLVFQGASYFRGVSRGQLYGLSARGLALSVAQPGGEEFPMFRRFWIEPMAGEPSGIIVHALLDSPSVAGAWRFEVWPGLTTTMDVSATLFPRRALAHVGLAPLTSMFMHGPMDAPDAPDYRPAVHDSNGISVFTGAGEWIYRPLSNPRSLQVSAFLDTDPQGFGLVQRARAFDHFQDLEAHYEKRPTAWVEPRGDWGPGHVELVEIPSDSEANDNVVAYWRPKAEVPAGKPFAFAYRLSWPNRVPMRDRTPQVQRSALGQNLRSGRPQVVIDWDTRQVPADAQLTAVASASAGRVLETLLQKNEETGGTRVFVTFAPGRAELVELRVELQLRLPPDDGSGEGDGSGTAPDTGTGTGTETGAGQGSGATDPERNDVGRAGKQSGNEAGNESGSEAGSEAGNDGSPAQPIGEIWLYRWLAE